MKKLIVMVLILMFAGTAYSAPCVGVTEATISNSESFSFCWDPNAVEDEVKQYNLMRNGVLLDVVPVTACDEERCDSPEYMETEKGVYTYTAIAVDVEDQQGEPSDPVTLTVIKLPPAKVINFSKE